MDRLQLGLSLCLNHPSKADHSFHPKNQIIKRNPSFTNQLPHTLPLFSANDDQHQPPQTPFSTILNKDEDEKNQEVGWPPIESWRKKALQWRRSQPPQTAVPISELQSNENSLFVKVKMEGVAITRKVNLRLYQSHNSLKNAILAMFSTYQAIDNDGWDFTLICEDRDGDWLLAEDLPWDSFIESVQRLKILVQKRNKD